VTVKDVLKYPNMRLRAVAQPVEDVGSPEVRRLIDDLAETMYVLDGRGLAATQVGHAVRVFVIDASDREAPADLRVFINPRILSSTGNVSMMEGCLSFPDTFEFVLRAERVVVAALDREGKGFTLEADGLLARAIQHEYDHLDGKLFTDRMSYLKRTYIEKRFCRGG
jgi:peptide deformylase